MSLLLLFFILFYSLLAMGLTSCFTAGDTQLHHHSRRSPGRGRDRLCSPFALARDCSSPRLSRRASVTQKLQTISSRAEPSSGLPSVRRDFTDGFQLPVERTLPAPTLPPPRVNTTTAPVALVHTFLMCCSFCILYMYKYPLFYI